MDCIKLVNSVNDGLIVVNIKSKPTTLIQCFSSMHLISPHFRGKLSTVFNHFDSIHSWMSTELNRKVPMQTRHEYHPILFLFLNKYSANTNVQFYFSISYHAFRSILHICTTHPLTWISTFKVWCCYVEKRNTATVYLSKFPVTA